MNTVKLLKLAPMLFMVAVLAYAVYSIYASLPAPAAGQSVPKKGGESMVREILAAGAATARSLAGEGLRNPFQVRTKPGAPQPQDATLDTEPTALAEIVRGLTLDATFRQGHDQLAIIDGRVYSQGQHLVFQGGSGTSVATLSLASVWPAKVILEGGGQNYELSFPDQLGGRAAKTHRAGGQPDAQAKSAIGATAKAGPARSRRPRGSRAASAATALTGNP